MKYTKETIVIIICTLLMNSTLLSCSEYSDEDYLDLQETLIERKQQQDAVIATLRRQLAEANANRLELNNEVGELNILVEQQKQLVIELVDIMNEMETAAPVSKWEWDNMVELYVNTLNELRDLQEDYEEAKKLIEELRG